jgi:two-component system phosphate regulon sensor histidine kinase PhoR
VSERYGLYRAVALALSASAPGLIVLAALAAWGLLAVGPALVAGAATLVATGLIIGRSATDLTRVRDAVGALAADDKAATLSGYIPRRHAGLAGELWLAIVRLTRMWSDRIHTADARLAAAEAVIASIPDPLILLDERRRVIHANAQAASFLGAVEGPRDLAAILRNPAVLGAADGVLRGEAARVVDFTLTVPIERHLQARFARIDRQSLDQDAVAVLSLHDITQLKRAEQMRADFIANASHELRTPLTTLTGFIETLRGPAREDAEARERFLAIMHEQAARMIRLVEDLLSLSRIELNEHVMPQGRVALGPLLRHLADTLELRAGERGMCIRLDLPLDLPDVLGERDELAQVFQNLVDNGIKYGRAASEITVAAATGVRPPYSGDTGESPFVSVAVRDRGDGIAREHLPRLTERFYRVDTARSREMGGTGLGLAIVKHILNRHRGFLDIESTPGSGSVFTVFLRPHPAATPAPCSSGGS